MSGGRTRRVLGVVAVGAALVVTAGCGTTAAEKTAAAALSQLAAYERDVNAKIRAESEFYDGVMANASMRIKGLWQEQQGATLDEDLRVFTSENLDATAEAVGPRLVALLQATLQSWASRDQEYESLLADTLKALADNRRKLEVEQAKIAELRNKLQPLSEVASDREMLKILIGFARETKAKLDELREANPPAAGNKP
jgi:hypothetical protein